MSEDYKEIKRTEYRSKLISFLLICLSFVIVSLGQPARCWWCGTIASIIGYALFWQFSLGLSTSKQRFWIGTCWFAGVQLVQLSWLVSHPYFYIYGVYFFLAFGIGAQFGFINLFVTQQRLKKWLTLFMIAALWTLLEWTRLFLLSGFSWNPIGLALTGNIYSLQMASLWGIYGLTFWVMLVNLTAVRTWFLARSSWSSDPRKILLSITLWLVIASAPFVYGAIHLSLHENQIAKKSKDSNPLVALLVQPSFAVEETLGFKTTGEFVKHIFDEWRHIAKLLSKYQHINVDVVVLPELIVPYGTYYPIFPLTAVTDVIKLYFGEEAVQKLPKMEDHLAMQVDTPSGSIWMVNNAFWVQTLANIFQSEVVVGLEDVDRISEQETRAYNAGFHLLPEKNSMARYEKRVLVPMGEYIPFSFCRSLAAQYGVKGSFTCGTEAKVMPGKKMPFGISICYEETYGHLMRENRLLGAELLVNLTSDIWYPNSTLPQQHFDHARLRTVENGIPLIRACNTGVTGAVDSLGRIVGILGEDAEEPEWVSGALLVEVPSYTYNTLYTHFGDWLIVVLSLILISIAFYFDS